MNAVQNLKVLPKILPILHGKLIHFRVFNILTERGNRSLKTRTRFRSMAEGCSQGHITGNVEEVVGDLFSCPDNYSLAHCISSDIKMGKGIAVLFKAKFGGVEELWNQGQYPGGLATLKRNGRYIYYLVTKERYWHKPTYDTLRASLIKMRDHNLEHNVKHVAMPEIGCGLDKLKWTNVLRCINEVYKGTDIHLRVYHFDGGNKTQQQRRGQRSDPATQDGGDRSNRGRNYGGRGRDNEYEICRSYKGGGRDSRGSGHERSSSGGGSGRSHGDKEAITRPNVCHDSRGHYDREMQSNDKGDRLRYEGGQRSEGKEDGDRSSGRRRGTDHRTAYRSEQLDEQRGDDGGGVQSQSCLHETKDCKRCDNDLHRSNNSLRHEQIDGDDEVGDGDDISGKQGQSQHERKDKESCKATKHRGKKNRGKKHREEQDVHMSGKDKSKAQENKKNTNESHR